MNQREEQLIDNNLETESNVMPSMHVNLKQEVVEECIITDEAMLKIYDEIMNDLRKDREEVSDLMTNFVNMVTNEGDATSASKEALVNLMKIKAELADKKSKVADLMTRIKLKDKDTFPKYLAAQQNNTIKIGVEKKKKRELLKIIEAERAKK